MFPMRGRKLSTTLPAILTFLFTCVFVPTARAQNENETIGFSSTHVFDGGYFGENIDTLNGNLNLTIPIGPSYRVNRNLSYQLKLVYNSKVWQFENAQYPSSAYTKLWGENPMGIGFSLSFGRLYRDQDLANSWSRWFFVTPDGTRHDMGSGTGAPIISNDTTYFDPQMLPEGSIPEKVVITDGTGMRYTLEHKVQIPDDVADLVEVNAAYGGWYVTLIEDMTSGSPSGRSCQEVCK